MLIPFPLTLRFDLYLAFSRIKKNNFADKNDNILYNHPMGVTHIAMVPNLLPRWLCKRDIICAGRTERLVDESQFTINLG